jgi:hypothetical protein
MGGGLCSASVVNNTLNDRTPYVLFADHCVSGSTSGYVFHFNYQSDTCSGTSGQLNQSVSGSTLLASSDINTGPDFALLEMTSDIHLCFHLHSDQQKGRMEFYHLKYY